MIERCGAQARGLTMRVFEHLFARIAELQQARKPKQNVRSGSSTAPLPGSMVS
jgi:hypothetical protein